MVSFLSLCLFFFFFNDTATTEIYTLSLHDALPISGEDLHGPAGDHRAAAQLRGSQPGRDRDHGPAAVARPADADRRRQTRALALLLSLPARPRVSRLRHPLRAGH